MLSGIGNNSKLPIFKEKVKDNLKSKASQRTKGVGNVAK